MALYRPPESSIVDFSGAGTGEAKTGFAGAAESLLAKQQENKRKAAKAARRDENRMLALSLLGLGSTIYNNQVQKRTKEILARKEFNLANAKDEAAKISALSRLGEGLVDENGVMFKSVEELRKQDPSLYRRAQSNYYNVAEAQLKKLYGRQWDTWKDSARVRRLINEGADGALRYLLDDGNLTGFYDKLRNINPANRDATLQELATKYANMTDVQYKNELGQLFTNKAEEYQNQRNIFSPTNFKNLLNQFGASFETQGKPNIWKNVTDADIVGPVPDEIFSAVKIGENLITRIDDVVSQIPKIDYVSWSNTTEGQATKDVIKGYAFTEKEIDEKIEYGAYDKQFVFKEDLDQILEEMGEANLEKAYRDASSLSKRLQDEFDFSKDFYLIEAQKAAKENGLTVGTSEFMTFVDNETTRFATNMQDDEASRSRVALAAVLRVGTELTDPLGPNWMRENVKYNPVKARALLTTPFKFDKGAGRFVADPSYTMANENIKKKLYMTQLHSILQSRNLDEGERDQLAKLFMGAVRSPFETTNPNNIIQLYQEFYLPNYRQRYSDPQLTDNINRGLLLGPLLEEREETFSL